MVYEAGVSHFDSKVLSDLPFEKVPLKKDRIPPEVWDGNVRAIIFSAIQPRQGPLNLIKSALLRQIPMVAIEESNQIALNLGISSNNNYLAPTEHVLVASQIERDYLVDMGVPGHRVKCTGWPFYTGPTGKTNQTEKRHMKERFGLDPDRPVAALALTAYGDSGENHEKRRQQLYLVAQGMPDEYQLVVKAHPIENLSTVTPIVQSIIPKATVLESNVPIADLITASDVLINRGVSQAGIESLLQGVPVVVLSIGHWTPFHEDAPDVVVQNGEELNRALVRLITESNPMHAYDNFLKRHVPYSPTEARRFTCQSIDEIATRGLLDPNPKEQWLDLALFQAWKLKANIALESLKLCSNSGYSSISQSLSDLVQCRASRHQLHELRHWSQGTFREEILRSLWISQFYQTKSDISEEDLVWMDTYPPQKNTPLHFDCVWRWIDVLIRSGYYDRAEQLAQKMHHEYSYNPIMHSLPFWIERYRANRYGRIQYKMWLRWMQIRPRLSQLHVQLKELRA